MKVMDKASLASRKKLPRAQTERVILQLLDHPFLPTLYTHFETDRFSCLVMEYCPGGDLHTLRQRQSGKLPAAGQASIARSTSVREGMGRSDVRDSKDWYYPAPVRTRKGKNSSLQDQEELMIDIFNVVTFKGSGDSFEEIDPTSFSGASHPPEPVDTGLMRPVYVPIGQSKPEGHFMGLLAWPWHRSLPSGLLMDGEAGFIYFFGPVAVAGRFWCWSEFCFVTERGCMCGFRRMVKVLKLLSTHSKMAREVCFGSSPCWVMQPAAYLCSAGVVSSVKNSEKIVCHPRAGPS